MRTPTTERAADAGVPEAIPRTLIRLRERLGVESLDRLWIFPPVRRGRREQGLIALSTFVENESRRGMVTVAYVAEHTGGGVTVEPAFNEEGEAPPDRFPGVMLGVVRRAGGGQGEAREIQIAGSPQKFEAMMEEFDSEFLSARDP